MATIISPRSESPAISIPRITSPSIASTSGTPTSSVRPSIDIPRSNTASPALQQHGTAGPGPGAGTTQRRNRAALRDYYNLKSRGPSGASTIDQHELSRKTSMASNASDSTITSSTPLAAEPPSPTLTAQMDDPAFDAEAYVAELLTKAGLRDVLRTESTLVSEIRNLDGERKSLVYDNYSKLIKAVGTIAEMQKGMHRQEPGRFGALARRKDDTPGLDGVDKLGDKFDGLLKVVKELSLGDEETEGSRRLVEARQKRRQKETVKWALDVPVRLQHLLSRGQRDEAAQEYDAVRAMLAQWDGVGGVEELRTKCAKAMEAAGSPDDLSKDGEDEAEDSD